MLNIMCTAQLMVTTLEPWISCNSMDILLCNVSLFSMYVHCTFVFEKIIFNYNGDNAIFVVIYHRQHCIISFWIIRFHHTMTWKIFILLSFATLNLYQFYSLWHLFRLIEVDFSRRFQANNYDISLTGFRYYNFIIWTIRNCNQ